MIITGFKEPLLNGSSPQSLTNIEVEVFFDEENNEYKAILPVDPMENTPTTTIVKLKSNTTQTRTEQRDELPVSIGNFKVKLNYKGLPINELLFNEADLGNVFLVDLQYTTVTVGTGWFNQFVSMAKQVINSSDIYISTYSDLTTNYPASETYKGRGAFAETSGEFYRCIYNTTDSIWEWRLDRVVSGGFVLQSVNTQQSDISYISDVILAFNRDVSASTVSSDYFKIYKVSDNSLIPVSILYGDDDTQIKLNPTDDLTAGEQYKLWISHSVADINGNTLSPTQDTEILFTPINETPSFITQPTIQVTATPNGQFTTRFIARDIETSPLSVEYAVDSGTFVSATPTINNETYDITITNQTWGSHNYQIKINDGVNYTTSNIFSVTIPQLSVPTNVVANSGNNLMNISWDTVPYADSYDIYLEEYDWEWGEWLDGGKINTSPVLTTTFQRANLAVDSTYRFRIKAINSLGQSEFSGYSNQAIFSSNTAPTATITASNVSTTGFTVKGTISGIAS